MKRILFILLIGANFGALSAAKEVRSIPSEKSFYDILAKPNVVVDFYADWCGPCKNMSPIFCDLSEEFSDVTFVKVNIVDYKQIADHYGVKSIPTFIFFKHGKRIHTVTGFKKKPEMKKELSKYY